MDQELRQDKTPNWEKWENTGHHTRLTSGTPTSDTSKDDFRSPLLKVPGSSRIPQHPKCLGES
jgi:hypothetical protein